MVGYVIYVGKSSMTINIDLYQNIENKWENAGHANFIVKVFSDDKNINLKQISFEGERSVIHNITRFEYGYAIKQNCMKTASETSFSSVPIGDEISQLHSQLIQSKTNFQPQSQILMKDTISESHIMIQPQDAVFNKTISAGKIL